MNAMNKELTAEGRGWRALALAELGAVEGGSPTLPLPPPSAFFSLVAHPTPWPWSVVPILEPEPPPW
jgi:hypothetical protein